MIELDCRGKSVAETGQALIARYNAGAPGSRYAVLLDGYPAGLRVWLLEAGARHLAQSIAGGGTRLEIERGANPAQGAIPGVHHLIAAGDSVWTCERARRVARIDAASNRVCAVRSVAARASHLALDRAGNRLFVADSGDDAVIALRADDLHEIARWDAPGGPHLPLVSPDGIVCVTGGGTGVLTIARPAGDGYAAQTVAVGDSPHDPLLDVQGAHVFVPCAGDDVIVKVRLDDGAVVGRYAAGGGPAHLARHPDGTRIYAANSWDGTVACLGTDGSPIARAASGAWAHAIDVAPDGSWVYVANFRDDTLAVFDAATLERVALLPTEPYPHGLDVSPDGRHVVASGFGSDRLRIYDARRHVELARVEVGAGSSHSAYSADGTRAYVGCSVSDHVALVDLDSGACVSRIRLPA